VGVETSFAEHVVQVFGDIRLLAIPSLVFLAVVAGVLFFLRRRLGVPDATAILVSVAGVLVVTVLGIALFEAAALWYRSVPHGSGHERQVGDFEDFYSLARGGFIALYASLVLVAVGSGWMLGRMLVNRGAAVAVVTGMAIVAFLVLTFPVVEFMNACYVGRSFLIDDVSC
jgi:hypothetical protein